MGFSRIWGSVGSGVQEYRRAVPLAPEGAVPPREVRFAGIAVWPAPHLRVGWGLGRLQSSGFRVQGAGFRVQGAGLTVDG